MPVATNKLVESLRKFRAPSAVLGAVLLAGGLLAHSVHAASSAAGPLDDGSVSAIVSLDQAMERVASRVQPAVVNVAVTSRSAEHQTAESGNDDGQDMPPGFSQFPGPMQGQPQKPQIQHGIGSGIIISPDGYIVTNNHVVEGATQMKVTLNDRRVFSAKLVGVDKLTDLAVIKINATDLPSVAWGDSSQLKPGQTVLAFGSPFGYFQNSVTRGIVSAVNRQNPYADDPRKPGGFIQTDAAINPGNSGGPLVNAHGELVGINTFIISNSGSFAGAGFAIPSQIVKATTAQLIKSGKVEHGYLGISMNDVTPDNAHFFNLQDATGAIVAQVTPGSPAANAGLLNGDVITQLNGQKVLNGSALQVAVSEDAPGSHISLGYMRHGKQQTVDLTVGEYYGKGNTQLADAGPGDAPNGGKLGLAVADVNSDVRQQLQIPDQLKGVAVANVRPESPADEAGIAQGDVILEVNRQPVQSAQQFASQVHSSGDKDVLLLVWSRGNASYRTIHPSDNSKSGM